MNDGLDVVLNVATAGVDAEERLDDPCAHALFGRSCGEGGKEERRLGESESVKRPVEYCAE